MAFDNDDLRRHPEWDLFCTTVDKRLGESACVHLPPAQTKANIRAPCRTRGRIEQTLEKHAACDPHFLKRGKDLDRKTDDKFRSGAMAIDGRIDLHGLNEARAFHSLDQFLKTHIAHGSRCLLVITGKGGTPKSTRIKIDLRTQGEGQPRVGVLRRQVPLWLQNSAYAPIILKCISAPAKWGGDGAYLILLRRHRG